MNGKPLLKDKDKKVKKKSNAKLKKELDKIFSQYIRQKYADKQGNVICYTCGAKKNWKEAQCGHFVSRSSLATRFCEDNVRVQCVGCNVFGGGKQVEFGRKLESENTGMVQLLFREAQKIVKDYPYEEKIEYYKEKIKELSTPLPLLFKIYNIK